MNNFTDSSQVLLEEMAMINEWISLLTQKKAQPDSTEHQKTERYFPEIPFSFCYGTRSSRDWVKRDNARYSKGEWQNGKRIHYLTWHDLDTSLNCTMELTQFFDFAAMEWIIKLRNDGNNETPLIIDFKALDIFWKCKTDGEMPELRRSLGSDGCHDDFQYVIEELRHSMWASSQKVRMDYDNNCDFRKVRNSSPPGQNNDSRTSATWLPFFNLRTGNDGLIFAIGWSGHWFAEFNHNGIGKTDISAGMEHINLKLLPGEEIRSPRIVQLYWKGTPIHSHNVFRQFVLKYHSPQNNGKTVEMPICSGSWGGTHTEGHLNYINDLAEHKLPYDYYWIDAGWYGTSSKPCPNVFEGDWYITGDWRVNKNYHPNGLKPVSNAAHKAGMKFLLWFEIARASQGTPVSLIHPDWFLHKDKEEIKNNDDLLLNFGNKDAWLWALETISSSINENGIDCYRQDFNIDPYPYFSYSDESDRKGMLEIRYVEGFYAFWDELLRRHPNLLIDNCASGGRLLDIETITRSVALWRTDYNSFPTINHDALQLHGTGLNLWLPLNATTPFANQGDTYGVRSAYSAGLILNVNEFGVANSITSIIQWEWFKKRIDEAKRLRPYFFGDFYPLTPNIIDPEAWMAYQLLLINEKSGAILAFRRAKSQIVKISFQLYGIEEEYIYEFEDADSGEILNFCGSELKSNGLEILLNVPRTCCLLFYKLIES